MNIRVIRAADTGNELDEVFITNDDPYVNRAIYTRPGVFEDGEITEEELSELEASLSELPAAETEEE